MAMSHGPVAVSWRHGDGSPLKVELIGRLEWTVPIVDDRGRLVGHLGADASGEAAGVTAWDFRPRRGEPRAAPVAERDRLARTGRMEAAIDEQGRVVLVRIGAR